MRLDVRGEMCPYPAMRTRAALEKLPEGEVLEVLTDHPPALSTVPFEGARKGFEAEIASVGRGEWRIVLHRTGAAYDAEAVVQRVAARVAELKGET